MPGSKFRSLGSKFDWPLNGRSHGWMDVRLLQLRLLKLQHALPPTYSTGVYKIAVLPFIAVRSPPSDSLASAPPMDLEWTCIAPSEHHRHSTRKI